MKRFLLVLSLSASAFGAAVIKTNPQLGTINRTLKVSAANLLDGSASSGITGFKWTCDSYFSGAPGTGRVTCPGGVSFSSDSIAGPLLTLPSNEGTYAIKLCAADGTTGCTTVDLGARNMDANGVIIPADPKVTAMFGPMIALGYNTLAPNQDKNALLGSLARSTDYDSLVPPPWDTARAGTINYPFVVPTGTTLSSQLLDTELSTMHLTDSTQVDLSTFPVIIQLGTVRFDYSGEYILVTGVSGNDLTIAYDGRGYGAGNLGGINVHHLGPTMWSAGTSVRVFKVTGSGTSLMSTFNPLGAGWSGQPINTTGTCQVTHNSTAIVGSGTSWVGPGVLATDPPKAIRISGHHGGVAFTFQSMIATVTDGTHLATTRVYPNTADDESGLVCATFNPDSRYMIVHHNRCGAGSFTGCVDEAYPYDGSMYVAVDGCFDDTDCFIYGGHDPDAALPGYGTCMSNPPYQNTVMECAKKVSYQDFLGTVNDSGINFYDEVLANWAGWFRSGLKSFLDAARKVGGVDGTNNIGTPFWPEIQQGTAGQPRDVSVAGMVAMFLFDGKTKNLQAMRTFANQTVGQIAGFSNCDVQDLRETIGYPLHWLALDALYDPDPTIRAAMVTQLGNWATTYGPCARTGAGVLANSWYNAKLFDTSSSPSLTMNVGTKVVTGTSIPSGVCGTTPTTTGTATFTPGSDDVIGTGFVTGGGRIVVVDGTLGNLAFGYTFISATHIRLSGQYPSTAAGGSGVVYGIDTEGGDPQFGTNPPIGTLTIGTSASDAQLTKVQFCTWTDSGHITMLSNWDGTGGTNYAWRSGLQGYTAIGGRLTEPFYFGILSLGLRWAAQVGGSVGTTFTTLLNNAVTWAKNYGIDPVTNGAYYQRIGPGDEPIFAESSAPAGFFRNLAGSFNTTNSGLQQSRDVAGEMQSIPSVSLLLDPSSANQIFWQNVETAIWGNSNGSQACQRTTWSGVAKYYGFCFGIGMSHQLPAALFGIGQPAPRQPSGQRYPASSRN